MPIVKVEKILSVNSEDPNFPAENLLNSDNNKKWKCKTGEKQASVILQLKQDTTIEGIDIGNANSAFVEVLVGKSSSQSSDFQVLLVASSLMTIKEAKDGTNANCVRFFKKTDLTKSTSEEKWDRVKIVCTQPFNKHLKYGLSFIVLHSPSQQDENENDGSIGRFALKKDDEEQMVTVGSWFAKRKNPPSPALPGAASAIRDALSCTSTAQSKKISPVQKKPKNSQVSETGAAPAIRDDLPSTRTAQNKKIFPPQKKPKNSQVSQNGEDDDDSPADDTDADSTYSPSKDVTSIISDDDDITDVSNEEDTGKHMKVKNNRKDTNGVRKRKINTGQIPKHKNSDSSSSSAKIAKVTKPFEKLLDGVTIVISGYQNPLRGNLRSMACIMGAKYKADWDNTCTHLICAFINTPKFNQVRGRGGRIVKKEWLEECNNRRRRLPWRRFALDRNDLGTSSEDEIWEEGSMPTSNSIAKGVNRECSSSGSDTEEEIERVRARQAAKKLSPPIQKKQKTDELKRPEKTRAKNTLNNINSYEDDTDVDSSTEIQTCELSLPNLPNFFNNMVFYIAADINEVERKTIRRYIVAYNGCIVDNINGHVGYVITESPDTGSKLSEEFGISAVPPEWVWACSDAEKLVPVTNFLSYEEIS